jgi:uncharacterized protein YerC
MFHRKFPNIKISSSTLRRIYLKAGIRYKAIERVKKVIDFNNEYYAELFVEMHSLIR